MPDIGTPAAAPTALTPREWAYHLANPHVSPPSFIDRGDDLAGQAHALMAMLNNAFPDGDPRKITRDDVTLIVDASTESMLPYTRPGLVVVAAKLRALLPPESPADGR